MTENSELNCKTCQDKTVLTQWGIIQVYLLPAKISLLLIIVGIILSPIFSVYWLFLSLVGVIIPLANADLRMLLYPYVAISKLFGREVNCPKCQPGASIFKIKL